MLQTYGSQGSPSDAYYDSGGQNLGLGHYFEILKRRWFYFVGAFGVVLLLGAFVTAIQRPIYQAAGKVLVESQQIPTQLVQPTITESANEGIQVIQQRIMTRDNLLAIVKKYGMFAKEQQWMSDTQILDLMRQRTSFDLVDLDSSPGIPSNATIAFTVSFQYEDPETALRVTNDLLTLILSEDARNRTTRATETTEFLKSESQRLQGELAAIDGQIAEKMARPQDDPADTSDPAKLQIEELTKLKEDLAQKSSIYSSAHPVIVALKRKIAAMEKLVAATPTKPAAEANSGLFELERQRAEIAKGLEDNNKKLEEARLGEKLERDQQAQRLQVIEQPVLPDRPIKPNRLKLLALTFVLAIAAGGGVLFAAEALDGSIRHGHELAAVAHGRLIVSIPYIATKAERLRRRSLFAVFGGVLGIAVLAGVAGFLFFGPPIDLTRFHQFWFEHLTSLTK
jgi:uncharacterized protein involved in exopolysaccharide biosynthesis